MSLYLYACDFKVGDLVLIENKSYIILSTKTTTDLELEECFVYFEFVGGGERWQFWATDVLCKLNCPDRIYDYQS